MTPLRYVTDEHQGIRRRRAGAGFVYQSPEGRRIRDAATLDRIRAIAIPPAWRDVWICPSPDGHIQATGRDARGRKQYRYHSAWTEARDEAKYGRMVAFGEALPKIRRQTSLDLKKPPLSRERVLATVVRLLEKTLIRIGNDEYARQNHSYGLTTLENRHVKVRGARLTFEFRAKSGIYQHIDVEDTELARSVKLCQELPGQKLFEYLDADGNTQSVDSSDVNEYLHRIVGEEFTAKDFRTWAGTVLAACALSATARQAPQARSKTARNRHVVAAIDQVSKALGNTRSVCRKCYVHPAILNSYLDGRTLALAPRLDEDAALQRVLGSRSVERAVLALLREASKTTSGVGSSYSRSTPTLANGKGQPGNSLATDRRGAATWRQQLIDSPNRRSRNSISSGPASKPRSRRRRITKLRTTAVQAS